MSVIITVKIQNNSGYEAYYIPIEIPYDCPNKDLDQVSFDISCHLDITGATIKKTSLGPVLVINILQEPFIPTHMSKLIGKRNIKKSTMPEGLNTTVFHHVSQWKFSLFDVSRSFE
jgi:hypothetical protein